MLPWILSCQGFTCLSVANQKTKKTVTDMANIAKKFEKLTILGGIFTNYGAIFLSSLLYNS